MFALVAKKKFAKKPFISFLFPKQAGALSSKQSAEEGKGGEGWSELSEKAAKVSTAWDQRLQEKKQPLLRVFTGSAANNQMEGNGYWIQLSHFPDEKTEASREF